MNNLLVLLKKINFFHTPIRLSKKTIFPNKAGYERSLIKNKFLRLLANLTICFTILLVSCDKSPQINEKSQTLRLNFQEGDLPTIHPHSLMIYLRGITLSKMLYEPLTRINALGKAELAGAEKVEISNDQLRYTFTLRDNYWSDGTAVTAKHYENAWKEALSPSSDCPRADLLYMIKNGKEAKKAEMPIESIGVKALNDHTLIVELAYVSPNFMELLAQPIAAPLKDPQKIDNALFNGPFYVAEWKKENQMILRPNPYYWDKNNISLNEVTIYMIQDTMTAHSLFERYEIDWVGVPLCPLSSELIHQYREENILKTQPVDRAFWVFLNTQHINLSSPLIRKALNLAIDKQAIIDHILIGGDPLNKPLPNALLPSKNQTLGDVNLAKKLFKLGLSELNFTIENYPAIEITYSQQANRKQLAEYLQQTWSQAFGIEVKLRPQEWTTLRSNLQKGEFEVSGCYEAAFYKDPLELLEHFTTLNSTNFSQWTNEEYTQVISSAKYELNPEIRFQKLSQAEKILADEQPFISICSDIIQFATHPHLYGYVFDYVGAVDFSKACFR